VQLNPRLARFGIDIRDLLFPLAESPTDEQARKAEERLKDQAARIEQTKSPEPYLLAYSALLSGEENRRQGAESRLTSILGLSSIAGTLVIGEILGVASGAVHFPNWIWTLVTLLGTLYLVFQISSATHAAVRGLSSQNHIAVTAGDLVADDGEDSDAFARRQAILRLRQYTDLQTINDSKITWMNTAHQALKQFIVGIAVLALLGTSFALTARPEDSTLRFIKQSQEIQHLLQGPTGPQGEKGQPGSPCLLPKPTATPPTSSHRRK
jgi:hypothetical protein